MPDDNVLNEEFYDKVIPPKKKGDDECGIDNDDYDGIEVNEKHKSLKKIFKDGDVLNDIKIEATLEEKKAAKKLVDSNYIFQTFKHDVYDSIYYVYRIYKQLIENDFPACPELNSYLFTAGVLRRCHIQYANSHSVRTANDTPVKEDRDLLDTINKLQKDLNILQKSLGEIRKSRKSGEDIHDLHRREMEECTDFIKKHIGEFTFKCEKCKTIVETNGLPFWAIGTEKNSKNETQYYIWSKEIAFLVEKGLLPVHLATFILRTSPEGLKYTANARGEVIKDFDMISEENKNRKLLLEFQEKNKHGN